MTESAEAEGISPEYANFLNHYQDFLKHYNYCHKITVIIKEKHVQKQVYLVKLLEEVMQAYNQATNSYHQAIEAYEEFRKKVLIDLFNKTY
ncbi:hypothetical protein DSM106972_087070 [Dulcicalothrix desertica PCC 7102]|uniref:Uncharacterized protein n=1 Tax=Dulcicalothrix desertica PCC 7102 TaxID=232991 RepID=A0A433URP5_9CYAN|nr:hypothetical protein [Dulcicalothrix desertica]RUS96520.1 hypothetical protein DSM106972_087070 [Dulcicalothrix desertica PCC 7102]TWH51365.1 hypothetical protein CAL7102_05772 [Dulcicalothrix desertica PCC 7102]